MADHLARRHTAPLPGGLGTDLAQPTKDFRFVQRMVWLFRHSFAPLMRCQTGVRGPSSLSVAFAMMLHCRMLRPFALIIKLEPITEILLYWPSRKIGGRGDW
jgi:hypothetical protein